ncbi:hypothetical protein D3C85_1544300 [compost metagenome]
MAGSEVFRLNLIHQKKVFVAERFNSSSTTQEQTVRIEWREINRKIKIKDPKQLIVRDAATGEVVLSRIRYKDKKPVEVALTATLVAGTSRFFKITTK